MDRKQIVEKYIQYRKNNSIDSILDLLTDDADLKTHEGKYYKGKDQLSRYYKVPQPMEPNVGEITIYNGNVLTVTLSFALGFKQIQCFFEFNDENKIKRIKLDSVGWF